VTLSGDSEDIDQLAEKLKQDSVSHRFLDVTTAFHSHQINSIRSAFLEKIGRIAAVAPQIPIHSTVGEHEMNHVYWYRNMRQTVLFHDALSKINSKSIFIEMASRELLVPQIRQNHSIAHIA
jgi:acyl transferase domain-containing protein